MVLNIRPMELHLLKPRIALNKAFLKVKPNRPEIETFKKNLIGILNTIDEFESEEFHKNLVSDFLKNTYYAGNHFINTKGRNDLVIHNGATASSTVGVIIEAKKPANKAEMLRPDNINCKAFQELVLYYLRERITNKNTEIKHLIATNINEWYIFDGQLFEKLFAQNKPLVKKFIDFHEGRSGGNKTEFFYSEIAAPAIAALPHDITFTHFDIREYDKPLRNNDKKDDNVLIALYKLLSPEHLLKLPFANDSNSLDKVFYTELLHIIGLTETKEGGKKLIQRKEKGQRNAASLLESAIVQLDNLDKLSRMDKPSQYGDTTEERLFNVALELSITWINRILFLKLLEAQLIKYHKGDKTYAFLNTDKVMGFDDLNTLFFQVLAKLPAERSDEVKQLFANVPYLNSSLFEPTDIEHICFTISQLKDGKLPVLSNSVIKDATGKKRTGELTTVEYLFEFLNAYDFSSEGSEEIQEDNKRLINASVLGLIFEKINGYKDGSFFTPGFITMYMCRETIRRAVMQKFNETKGWNCADLHELYDKIEDRKEANAIINSLKLCDPAVGSGHFLVSALNEIIAIKSELRILSDRDGKRMKEYSVVVENDELIVTDEDGHLFEYNPLSKESQRVQETLFNEKQTIIENCLFGVDLNPNSVKICRLRLWIELLKNAYYQTTGELETLPNIDINIKCGNSLISRFALDADLKQALKSSKYSIVSYRSAVETYRNAENKEQKREMEKLIASIKSDFKSNIDNPFKKRISTIRGTVDNLATKINTAKQWGEKTDKKLLKEFETAVAKLDKLEKERDDIESNKIYENAFEWRFEFPEVLNDDGDFMGFDVVIGNPPYIRQEEFKDIKSYLSNKYDCFNATADLYVYFVDLAINLMSFDGKFAFIIPNKWMKAGYGNNLREFLLSKKIESIIDYGDLPVFEEASTYPCILEITNKISDKKFYSTKICSLDFGLSLEHVVANNRIEINVDTLNDKGWDLSEKSYSDLIIKMKLNSISLSKHINDNFFYGIKTGCNEAFIIDENTRSEIISADDNSEKIIKPFLAGRDIKRYEQPKSKKYLILAQRDIKIEEYPAVYAHLSKYRAKLENKAGNGKWYELQASPGEISKFEKSKIMYPDISKNLNFILDDNGHYSVNTVYNIGSNSKALLGYLNSKLFLFYFQTVSNSIRGGYLRFFTDYMKECPVPEGIESLETIVNQIYDLKSLSSSADTTTLESEIDQLVYQLYGLTEEEIKIVEGEK